MAASANPNAPATVGLLTRLMRKIDPTSDPNSTNTNRGKFSLDRTVVNASRFTNNMAGRAVKNVGANLVSNHWNESGLSNIFGGIGKWDKKTGKFKKKGKKGNGVNSKSGIGSTDITRLIKAFRDGLSPLEESLDGIDGSMSGLRDDIQKLDENLRKGFTALLRTFNSNAQNPFGSLRDKRKKILVPRPVIPPPPPPVKKGLLGSILGGAAGILGGLFGRSGMIGAGLSTILGLTKNLGLVTKILAGSVGALVKFAGALAAPLGRGLVAVAGAAALALGKAGKGVARSLRRGGTTRAPTPPTANPEASRGRVRPGARPSPVVPETGTPRATVPEATAPRPAGTPEARAGRPTATPEPTAPRPTGTPEPTAPRPAGAPEVAGRPNAPVPEPTAPRPTPSPEPTAPRPTSTPAGEVAKPSASVTEGAVKETLKETGKLASKTTLKGVLSKIGGPALVLAVEGIDGFIEWSKAYDEMQEGKITKEEFKKTQTKVIGKAMGGVGGALIGGAIGAAVGSIVPVGGTIVGGLVGSVAGAWKGHELGDQLGDAVYNTFQKEQAQPNDPAGPVLPNRPPELQGRTPAMVATPATFGPNGQPEPSSLRRMMTRRRNEVQGTPGTTENLAPAPTTHGPVNRMVGQSEQNASRAMTMPPIVNAPQTTNNYNGGSGNGGGNASPSTQAPGSTRPTFNSLDFQAMGLGIPGLPG